MSSPKRDLFKNRYNAAAWRDPETGNTVIMAREVERGAEDGAPDRGKLVKIVVNKKNKLIQEEVIWQPENDDQHLEDPRALALPDGNVVIGLTAVLKSGEKYMPYPALTTWNAEKKMSELMVIDKFGPGKNLTPFDTDTWVFRKDDSDHKLLILKIKNNDATEIGELDFSEHIPSWATYRMGTTISPIWLTPRQALMIIHGIRFENGIYHYSIGRAKIIKNRHGYKVAWVDETPLITPTDFTLDGNPIYGELHDYRRVVYVCGGVIKRINFRENLVLYVNVGDSQTVEVPISMEKLLKGFKISRVLPLPAILLRIFDNEETKNIRFGYYRLWSDTVKTINAIPLTKLNEKMKVPWEKIKLFDIGLFKTEENK